MAKHLDFGVRGENLAKEYLIQKGFQILETNWRFSRAEVDIIAMDGEALVFIEVKTRSDDYMGTPDQFVTTKKEELMADAASVYMEKIGHEWEIRFDIMAIIIRDNSDISITYFEDAFFPGW